MNFSACPFNMYILHSWSQDCRLTVSTRCFHEICKEESIGVRSAVTAEGAKGLTVQGGPLKDRVNRAKESTPGGLAGVELTKEYRFYLRAYLLEKRMQVALIALQTHRALTQPLQDCRRDSHANINSY